MKITKENNDMVIRIPLFQKMIDVYGDGDLGETNNLIGIVAGNEYSISQLIDLAYKDDQQEGNPILMFDTEEELREICKEFDLDVWVHPICAYCKLVIRGSYTSGEKGDMCRDCENIKKA